MDFWRPKLCEISVQICNLKNWTPDTFKWLSCVSLWQHPYNFYCYALPIIWTLRYTFICILGLHNFVYRWQTIQLDDKWAYPLFSEILSFVISVIASLGLKDRVWFGLCHFLVTAHVIFVQSSSSTWGNISLPLYESTESCESLLQVEWQPDLSSQQNIFSLDYGLQVDIMWCWKLNRHGVFLSLGWYLLCFALVTKVFVLQILTIDIHQWGQSKGSSNSKYMVFQ